jgi:hypothetical protein
MTNKCSFIILVALSMLTASCVSSRKEPAQWVKYENNPVLGDGWDASACYKPFVIREKDRWMLWYNERNGGLERIGLAIFDGKDLEF